MRHDNCCEASCSCQQSSSGLLDLDLILVLGQPRIVARAAEVVHPHHSPLHYYRFLLLMLAPLDSPYYKIISYNL